MKRPTDLSSFPDMVQWFSPRLLMRAGFRQSISRLFGQYADQRMIQHLSDPIPTKDNEQEYRQFVDRYNYTDAVNSSEPFWADFTADLGDGFDSTYSVAYMLAAPELRGDNRVSGIAPVQDLAEHEKLPRGQILILGGDQVYPWPSQEEYESRMVSPYSLAFPDEGVASNNAPHDIFAIPGNHDWFDGLEAFDDLFCRARTQRHTHKSPKIGNWFTRQHRSYFALRLPHNWWIWGADIQLSKYLDDGQLDYFSTIAGEMGENDKFILCTAQPSWLYFGTEAEGYARDNLRSLIDMPISKGAKLCGVLSGDSHLYCRYNESDKLGNFNLITAGGGGAYTHGTYHLEKEIKFNWLGEPLDFDLDRKLEPSATDGHSTQTTKPAAYPTKARSRSLALGNIFFPFRNVSFCLGMAMIYWLLTWTFSELRVEYNLQTEQTQVIKKEVETEVKRQLREKIDKLQKRRTREFVPEDSPTVRVEPAPMAMPEEVSPEQPIGTWTISVIDIYLKTVEDHGRLSTRGLWGAATLIVNSTYLLALGIASSPLAFIFLSAIWYVFFAIAQSKLKGTRGTLSRLFSGTLHFSVHLLTMWVLYCFLTYTNRTFFRPLLDKYASDAGIFFFLPTDLWERLLYPPEMFLLGGLGSGFVFGLYLLFSYYFKKLNIDWTFSAQRQTKFKNFLRMRFEPDRLTIYPIGLDSSPRRRRHWFSMRPGGWKNSSRDATEGGSRIEPRSDLAPRLIEGPIIIDSNDVINLPR